MGGPVRGPRAERVEGLLKLNLSQAYDPAQSASLRPPGANMESDVPGCEGCEWGTGTFGLGPGGGGPPTPLSARPLCRGI